MRVNRTIAWAVRRLTGTAGTAAGRAPVEPSAEGSPEEPSRAQVRPAAAEITSSTEFGELAAALNAVTQLVWSRAREQRRVRDAIAAERDLVDSVLRVAGRQLLVVVLDQAGRIIQFNRACESTTGYRSSEVEGRTISELFLLPEEIDYAAPAFGEPAASAPEFPLPRSFVCTWVGRDNRHHHIAWSNAGVIDKPSGNTYVVATGLDITDRLAAEADLRQAQERFRLAFDNAPIGMCLLSPDGRFVQVNRALGETLGRTQTELLDLNVADVAHPGDVLAIRRIIADMRLGQAYSRHDEIRFLLADDRVVWARMSVSAVPWDNREPLYYLTQIQDITARRAAEERLAQQALHDPLTGLPNRALLMEQLQFELSGGSRRNGLTGLLYADLDGFRMINDSLGHSIADEVLSTLR